MKILLTGANGFVAKRFVEMYADKHEIIALGRTPVPGEAGEKVGFIACDLGSAAGLPDLIASGGLPEKIDAVVHMAVSRGHRDFPETAIDLFQVNTAATIYLLDYARRAGASNFILGSTCSVYDGVEERPVPENCNPTPTRFWPGTKYSADMMAGFYKDFFASCVIRYATPYGPGQTDRFLPAIINRVSNDMAVSLPMDGDGIIIRPIYVDDAAELIDRAIRENWQGIVNGVGDEVLNLVQTATRIGAIVGKTPNFERDPNAGAYDIVADNTELRRRLGDHALTGFDEGLKRTIAG